MRAFGEFDLGLPGEVARLSAEARRLGERAAGRRSHKENSWVLGYDRAFSLELGARGWLGMTWPRGEGGWGRTPLERFVVTEALISTGAPIAASWVGDRQIGPTLLAHGTPGQRRRHIPPMVAGTTSWCLGLSEPDAGSDLASVRTRATERGSGFVLHGVKVWTSFAADADLCYVVACTDPEAPAHAGLSEFIVDMGVRGVEVSPLRDMTGGEHFAEIRFDGVHVPGDALVGRPNGSWRQLMRQLGDERAGIDRLVSLSALLDDTLAAVPVSGAVLRQRASDVVARLRLGRLLVLRQTMGGEPPAFSAVVKVFCTEVERDVANLVADVVGADAQLQGRASDAVVYAPAYTIQGGTSEVLRTMIGDRLLGLPR